MCGSPSVGNRPWKGFLCCSVAVFCSSPSWLLEEIGDDSDEDEAIDAEEQSEIDDASEGDDNSDKNDNDYDDNDDYGKDDDVDDNDNDNGDSEEVQIIDILCTTKSGRTCRTWKGRYLYFWFH